MKGRRRGAPPRVAEPPFEKWDRSEHHGAGSPGKRAQEGRRDLSERIREAPGTARGPEGGRGGDGGKEQGRRGRGPRPQEDECPDPRRIPRPQAPGRSPRGSSERVAGEGRRAQGRPGD